MNFIARRFLSQINSMRYLILVIISASIVLSSCGGIIRSYIRKDKNNTPTDYGNSAVLVIKHKKKYNKNLESAFVKNYKGEYLLIDLKDTSQYTDTDKYRYIFDNNVEISRGSGPIGSSTPTTSSMSFYLVDRKTRARYSTEISSGAYTVVLNAYVKKLDDARLKNQH
jgi:hypothetical protein